MGKVTFIVGGARSGKSSQAIKLAKKIGRRVVFLATGSAKDKEMAERIKIHKQNRPANWQTFELANKLSIFLKKINSNFNLVIIDCLTLLVSNLLLAKFSESRIEEEVIEILKVLKSAKFKTIIVSNEVGLGIVPQNKLARKFRDLAGRINQIVAEGADDVFFMASGLALQIKGEPK